LVPDPPTLAPLDDQAITARLAGAGSMRADIEHVMATVPDGATPAEYRRAILDENAARKGTGTSRMWAWKRLKLRYALDRPETVEFAAFRRAMRDSDPAGRGLSAMLMFARLDRLFRETTLDVLAPRLARPEEVIPIQLVRENVEGRRRAAGLEWSDESLASVANHLASSWKDFGLVEGSKERRIARLRPSHATTRFAVELGRAEGRTDRQVLDAPWFRLLGMDVGDAESALRAAARAGVLGFRTQADVVELDLEPAAHRAEGG
jgi:hypothetical protein